MTGRFEAKGLSKNKSRELQDAYRAMMSIIGWGRSGWIDRGGHSGFNWVSKMSWMRVDFELWTYLHRLDWELDINLNRTKTSFKRYTAEVDPCRNVGSRWFGLNCRLRYRIE